MEHVRETTLTKYKLAAVQYITPELLKHFGELSKIDVSEHQSFMFDETVLRVVQMVWGKETECIEHHWPANWWEAFRERWFPNWAKDRRPIRYSKCTLIAQEMYPKVAMPEREHSIVLHKIIDDQAPSRVKCPYCGHKNIARAGACAYCDEYLR